MPVTSTLEVEAICDSSTNLVHGHSTMKGCIVPRGLQARTGHQGQVWWVPRWFSVGTYLRGPGRPVGCSPQKATALTYLYVAR